MEYRVISTDNHINEPPGVYVDRVPKQLKDRAPRLLRGEDGGDGWSMDGKPPKVTLGLGATGAITGQDYKKYKKNGIKFEELLPGNYDGAAHIKDNEIDGVDAATIYPAAVGGAYMIPDREMALACVRAYNDWLIEDFCSVDPSRLLSLAFMPVDDGSETLLAEAERVIEKGAAGLALPLPEVAYHDSMYDPLWKLAAEAKVPVTIHRVGVNKKQNVEAQLEAAPGINVVGIVQRFFSAIGPISNMIYTGVFQRFPELVFVAAEVNGGWLPSLAMQMDQEWERQRHWSKLPIEEPPSNFLGKNVFVTILDDTVGFNMARTDAMLARAAMFSTDYPHSTTLWPRSQQVIAELTEGMDPTVKHQILAGNAVRAYHLNTA
jgi:predicted TIM-barrel fold metal-dependent hydrolase